MADDALTEDELELELRPAISAAGRLLILSALLDRFALEAAVSDDASEVQAAAFDLREWLKAETILPMATPRERLLLETPVGALSEQSLADAPLLVESFACLAWSLGLGALPAFGTERDIAALIAALPHPWDSSKDWLAGQGVLPLEEIAMAREAAEVWEWRLSAEQTRKYMSDAELAEMDLAIRETEADAVAHGILLPGGSTGFAVAGEPVTLIPPDDLDDLRQLAATRLQSFNWLCGYGNDWDSVPLEI